MAQTLLLDTVAWDLVLDVNGNIAVASAPYSLAQDAASSIKTFLGEEYYDTTTGIPYFTEVLGQFPPLPLLKSLFVAAAKEVPDVASAVCFISGIADRTLSGQVQVTSANTGQTAATSFSVANPQGA